MNLPLLAVDGVDRVVDALGRVASASQFTWLREAIGVGVFLVSLIRIAYPLYYDFRNTRGGRVLNTPDGPMTYKHACEVALDENIRMDLRNQALERALDAAKAEADRARAECAKETAEIRLAFAAEKARLVDALNDLRAQLASSQERVVGNGFGDPGDGE